MSLKVKTGMVTSAGIGTRMRPLTDTKPKPLIEVKGRTMLDWALDHLAAAGVERAIVNVHHFADQIESHVAARRNPSVLISDERAQLLDTGGGVVQALPLIGDDPFFLMHGDVVWRNGTTPALDRMAAAWDDSEMDAIMMVVLAAAAHGYEGRGDFNVSTDGTPSWREERHEAPFVFTGLRLIHPRALQGYAPEPFSFLKVFQDLMERGRLKALIHDGDWFHVGTPDAIATTEELLDAIRPDYNR